MARPTVPYVGNFRAPHSTENHVADALRALGIDVMPIQEDDSSAWDSLGAVERLEAYEPEFVLWTHTYGLAPEGGFNWVKHWRERGVTTVGYHLDRWIGLERETALDTEPFFRQDLLVTADGGHAQEWQDRGINHVWMPPAVARVEAEREGVFRDEFDYDVVFVGSWQNYHPDDWPYRRQLIERLLDRYPGRFRPFCCHYRGQDLADLYATARVVVGDSCLAGSTSNYWSDRIPETLGRGGFLIHPDVEGLDDWYEPGRDLATYPLGDFDGLFHEIDGALADEIGRRKIATTGRALVLSHDLYEHRMVELRRLVAARGDLSDWRGPLTVANQGVVGEFEVRRPGDGIVFEETWRQNQYGFRREEMVGRTVLDIGANVGDFAIWAALAGATKVWAYEPDPANRAEMEANLRLNPRAATVEVVGEAAWSASGEVWLTAEQGSVKVIDPPDTLTGPERPVDARHVDEVLARAGSSLIVKIDCEGCEYDVFRAVTAGQLRRADRIVMEWHSGDGFGGDRTEDWGRMVATLAAEGEVTTMGQPKLGGMLRWRRYGT
jgi:FkbM family methyltransferase